MLSGTYTYCLIIFSLYTVSISHLSKSFQHLSKLLLLEQILLSLRALLYGISFLQ